jgi:hypothetical protein
MIKRITLTKEHLKLIPFFYEQEEGDNKIVFDKAHLYNLGSHLLEDLAMILGYNDSAIKGTEEDPDGKAFPDEIEAHMLEVHNYIVDNFFYIESLIHFYVTRGGLTEGEYKCKDNELIWEKISN